MHWLFGYYRRITPLGLVLFILLSVGVYFWNRRPLSEREQKLVGTWANNSDSRTQIRLDPDRSAYLRPPSNLVRPRHSKGEPQAELEEELPFMRIGRWSVGDDSIHIWNRRGSIDVSWTVWSSGPRSSGFRSGPGGWRGTNPRRWLEIHDDNYVQFDSELYFRVQTAPADPSAPADPTAPADTTAAKALPEVTSAG